MVGLCEQWRLPTPSQGNIIKPPAVQCYYKCLPTFPSRLSCCISCSLLPIPMNAHGWASCSVQPSFSMLSSFFCQPLPIRYTQGGGQKNLIDTSRGQKTCRSTNASVLNSREFPIKHTQIQSMQLLTNLFSLPYDFCATFACSMSTVWSSFPFK